MSDIVNSVLSWKSLDIQYLDNLIDTYDLDSDQVVLERDANFGGDGSLSINSYISTVLDMAYYNFKTKVEEFSGEDSLYDFNEGVYCNYLDSGYDSILSDFDITDFSDENIQDFLDRVESI